MPIDPVDELLTRLTDNGGAWPPRRERDVHDTIQTYRAFLETDRDALRSLAQWPKDRDYKVDPLPALIADAWADHIFGDDPLIQPANDADAGALELLLEANGDLAGELHAAERRTVAEGEQWWRVYADLDVADAPLLEWHSRDEVLPLYVGGRLLAVALVTELDRLPRRKQAVYRHLEIHVDGFVEHVLWRGSKTRIGETVPLEEHPGLEELAKALSGDAGTTTARRWLHGLPMLMGRVTNGRGRDRRLGIGVSDYHGIADYLLDLNEAATIGAENVRLTAKKRAIIPEESLQPRGPELVDNGAGGFVAQAANPRHRFDAGEDVLTVSKLDAELGTGADAPFRVLEYSFDAQALIVYKRDVVETCLTRVGLTPQVVGVVGGEGGLALSGTALRIRLIPTTKAGKGKARPWDDTLPGTVALMARLDALPVQQGGFGRSWSDPATPFSVERGESLPVDEIEESQVEATLVGAGVRSVRTSVARQHPDWSDELVDEEVERIKAERPSGGGLLGGGLA